MVKRIEEEEEEKAKECGKWLLCVLEEEKRDIEGRIGKEEES